MKYKLVKEAQIQCACLKVWVVNNEFALFSMHGCVSIQKHEINIAFFEFAFGGQIHPELALQLVLKDCQCLCAETNVKQFFFFFYFLAFQSSLCSLVYSNCKLLLFLPSLLPFCRKQVIDPNRSERGSWYNISNCKKFRSINYDLLLAEKTYKKYFISTFVLK